MIIFYIIPHIHVTSAIFFSSYTSEWEENMHMAQTQKLRAENTLVKFLT